MPESVRDRPSKAHEYLFMLTKRPAYRYDKSPPRGTVWSASTARTEGIHFATMPIAIVEPCVRSSSRPGDVVLDPFAGSGTTAETSLRLGRVAIAIELNPDYLPLIQRRAARGYSEDVW